MKILALDTATEACSVALEVDGRLLESYVELERGHAEQLLPMIDAVLLEAGQPLGELDAIAFGRGPGAFTGVRLAASVVQGLAFGADIGVVPVSDLAAVAQHALQLHPGATRILAVNDARMREVYSAEFAVDDLVVVSQEAEKVGPADSVQPPEAPPHGSWIAAGRGLAVSPGLEARCRRVAAAIFPQLPPEGAVPVYVRDRVAEIPSGL
jgi:tRNA threonylcarbamoyladenosine biosynthesis protein TsaB